MLWFSTLTEILGFESNGDFCLLHRRGWGDRITETLCIFPASGFFHHKSLFSSLPWLLLQFIQESQQLGKGTLVPVSSISIQEQWHVSLFFFPLCLWIAQYFSGVYLGFWQDPAILGLDHSFFVLQQVVAFTWRKWRNEKTEWKARWVGGGITSSF